LGTTFEGGQERGEEVVRREEGGEGGVVIGGKG
jgi:hypothetical protein